MYVPVYFTLAKAKKGKAKEEKCCDFIHRTFKGLFCRCILIKFTMVLKLTMQ